MYRMTYLLNRVLNRALYTNFIALAIGPFVNNFLLVRQSNVVRRDAKLGSSICRSMLEQARRLASVPPESGRGMLPRDSGGHLAFPPQKGQ